MKADREFKKITVTRKAELFTSGGHPWIFDTEILLASDGIENGEIVDVVNEKGKYIGSGFVSFSSKIRVRLISRNANDRFDEDFFRRRIKYAWDYRKNVMGGDLNCCRIIFGEADQFPGLTVDKFNDILVTQTLSYGIEIRKDLIFRLLYEVLTEDGQIINGLFERNDVAIRSLEGLNEYKGWYDLPGVKEPDTTCTEIIENGIRYKVDFENGQKTGFFLDQKYNRLAISKYSSGKKVLDCFTHTGSFALNAAKGGASSVLACDISESAIQMAEYNAKINGLDGVISFITEDVFELLPELEAKGEKFDMVILDPPAFTKSRKTFSNAFKGYKEINYRAMKLVRRGGYFATCSCSHFMPDDQFVKMLHSASSDADVMLRQIEARQQAPDHPILWNVPETDYLKFYIFQVI